MCKIYIYVRIFSINNHSSQHFYGICWNVGGMHYTVKIKLLKILNLWKKLLENLNYIYILLFNLHDTTNLNFKGFVCFKSDFDDMSLSYILDFDMFCKLIDRNYQIYFFFFKLLESPWYSWNIAESGVKHQQSINQSNSWYNVII